MLWSLARPGALYKAVRDEQSQAREGCELCVCRYIGVVCVECSVKNGDEVEDALGKADKHIPPKAERRREQGWDDWDGYGKVMYVIPHYRQASLPNCDLPAV